MVGGGGGAAPQVRICLRGAFDRIYCRSDCPARRLARAQVRFFSAAAAAEAARFRPRRRCRPQAAAAERADLERLLALLAASEALPPARMAERGGLEPGYIRRLFKRELGLSPSAYARALRAERLRAGLRAGASVTEALYAAGYGSSHPLYRTATETLGMTPGSYRQGGAGAVIRYAFFESDLGTGLIAATARGVCALRFGEGLRELEAEFPRAQIVEDAAALEPLIGAVRAHLASAPELELPLDVSPTVFQARVWQR